MATNEGDVAKKQKLDGAANKALQDAIRDLRVLDLSMPPLKTHTMGRPLDEYFADCTTQGLKRGGLTFKGEAGEKIKVYDYYHDADDDDGAGNVPSGYEEEPESDSDGPDIEADPSYTATDFDEMPVDELKAGGLTRESAKSLWRLMQKEGGGLGHEHIETGEVQEIFRMSEYLGSQWRELAEKLDEVEPDEEALTEGLQIEPHDWQLKGAAQGVESCNGPMRGFLLGDRPGLGKTLTGYMIAKALRRQRGCHNLIVCPAHVCRQWKKEIESYHSPDNQPRVLVLTSANYSAQELLAMELDVVITSYELVEYCARAELRYIQLLDLWDRNLLKQPPKKPKNPFASAVYRRLEKAIPCLLLDECQKISRQNGARLRAIKGLAYLSVVAMSGTLLANKWYDVWGPLSLLDGHPMRTFKKFQSKFRSKVAGGQLLEPNANQVKLLQRLLLAFTIARPSSLLKLDNVEHHVYHFQLPLFEAGEVADLVLKFDDAQRELHAAREKAAAMAAKAKKGKGKGKKQTAAAEEEDQIEGHDNIRPLLHLVLAQLYTLHTSLEAQTRKRMEARRAKAKAARAAERAAERAGQVESAEDEEEPESDYDDEEKPEDVDNAEAVAEVDSPVCQDGEKREAWLKRVRALPDKKLHSARSRAFLKLLALIKKRHPGERILVFSKFLRFLDILDAALGQEHPETHVYRFDGTVSVARRDIVKHDFEQSEPGSIMLMTGDAGGTGLNLTCASIVVQTEIWWNCNTEYQALCRVHRMGATTKVHRYLLFASNSVIDHRIMQVQSLKEQQNSEILAAIMREHTEPLEWPEIWESGLQVMPHDVMAELQGASTS